MILLMVIALATAANAAGYFEDFEDASPMVLLTADPNVYDPNLIPTEGVYWYEGGATTITDANELQFARPGSSGWSSVTFAVDESQLSGAGVYILQYDFVFKNHDASRVFAGVYDIDFSAATSITVENVFYGWWDRTFPDTVTVEGTTATLLASICNGSAGSTQTLLFNYDGSGDLLVRLGGGRDKALWSAVRIDNVLLDVVPPSAVLDQNYVITWVDNQPTDLSAVTYGLDASHITGRQWTVEAASGSGYDPIAPPSDPNAFITDTTVDPLVPTASFTVPNEPNYIGQYQVTLTVNTTIAGDLSDGLWLDTQATMCDAYEHASWGWPSYEPADFNEDCIVDLSDYAVLASVWLDEKMTEAAVGTD